MDTNFVAHFWPQHLFEVLEYIEGKALLRLDIEKGVKIGVCDIKIKDGLTVEDVELPKGWTILNVLKEKDNTYTCLVRVEYKTITKIQLPEDIIFDLPYILSEEKVVFAFAADNEGMKRVLSHINLLGYTKSVSFQLATFSEYNILSCLTERQREVITTAKKSGYYDVPRRISTEELSKKLGISRATTIEHLRKAENRIISHVLEGY